MKLTYYGHSAFLLKTGDTEILVDPFISGNPLAKGVVSADQLKPDYILLTHAHGDHWGDTAEIAKRSNALVVANFEITQYLARKHGYDHTLGMNSGGSWDFDWGRLTVTYARHSSSFPDGTYGGNPNGFLIHAEGKIVYDLGDTEPFAEMAWIGDSYAIDLALMPIGDCFTMCPDTSIRAADMLHPGLTVPIHYNTFPAIEVDAPKWVDLMGDSGHNAVIVRPGESLEI